MMHVADCFLWISKRHPKLIHQEGHAHIGSMYLGRLLHHKTYLLSRPGCLSQSISVCKAMHTGKRNLLVLDNVSRISYYHD